MGNKKKFYVVWEGNEPGIYESWTECQQQIKGFPGAIYKSFKSKEEALNAFYGDFSDHLGKSKDKPKQNKISFSSQIEKNSWSVDAACSGNPGDMEYRGVWTETGEEIFKQGPFKKGTNNIGEFLAIVHALALLKKQNNSERIIYTDSKTAMAWIRNKKVKTTLEKDATNAILFELMDRGINWLKSNTYKNPIVKWETKEWGEIPADFGRK